MAKAKKKKQLKVVKTTAKPKGKEIKTKSLGTLFYGSSIEKNIIQKMDNLLNAVRGIQGTQVPELAIELVPYLKANKKTQIDTKVVRTYLYNLVDYKTKDKFGNNIGNKSFENNVTRAIALALLIENKTTGTKISKVKGKYQLMAISNQAFPKLNQYNHKLKKAQEVKNTVTDHVQINYEDLMEMHSRITLGQKTNNKKSKKDSTPKDNKSKTVTADNVINLMIKLLTNLNSLPKNKIVNNIKGQTERNLLQIAKNILRLLAKKSVLNVSEDGKVTAINEVQFTATFEKQNEWAKKHFNNAIKNYALEPVLKNTGTSNK